MIIFMRTVCPIVCPRIICICCLPVASYSIIQSMQVGKGVYWMCYQFKIGSLKLFRKLCLDTVCILFQFCPIIHHAGKLVIVGKTVRIGIKQLRLAPGGILSISLQQGPNSGSMCLAKLLPRPLAVIAYQVFGIPLSRLPGVIKEKANGKLHWFQVAYVYDPDSVYAGFICQVHLFPNPGKII